ncbi:MAG: YceI family protein [Candidatus Cyclobacteriaceae bacterium M2_1C_046]
MKTFIFILFLSFSYSLSVAQTYYTDNGYARFRAEAPLNSYSGESNDLQGSVNLDTKEVQFKLKVRSLDTDNDQRDQDMYELMNVSQYPYIEFNGRIADDLNLNKGKQKLTVKGEMRVRDVTREISIEGAIQKEGDKLRIEASWDLLLSDYNIEQPSILFYEVEDRHNIYVSAVLKKGTK